jgi:hypothetical protein
MKLTVPITNDPVTGSAREAEMQAFTATKDFDFAVTIEIFEKNNQGQRLFDIANTLQNKQQRDAAKEKHFPLKKEYSTAGSFVNAQGQVDENGTTPESQFLATLTVAQVLAATGKTTSDSFVETLKTYIGLQIQQISARGQN